jgi:hypothetical protein
MEVNSEHKIMRAELGVEHCSLCKAEEKNTEQDYYHRWTRLFVTCSGVLLAHFQKPGNSCQCHIPLRSSADTTVSVRRKRPRLWTARAPQCHISCGACSSVDSSGTQTGTFWSPGLKAQISRWAIFTSSVCRKKTVLTFVCRTVHRLNVRCRCSYDYCRCRLTRLLIRSW